MEVLTLFHWPSLGRCIGFWPLARQPFVPIDFALIQGGDVVRAGYIGFFMTPALSQIYSVERLPRWNCRRSDYEEFITFAIPFELHLVLFEGELDRRIRGDNVLVGWLGLTNLIFGGFRANRILLA